MEPTVSNNSPINKKADEIIATEKLEWVAPSLAVIDLSLETYDGLIPSIDLDPASFVS